MAFWDEIWGCVKYIKIPYDTVMSMPIQNRKLWIQKHNSEQEEIQKSAERGKNGQMISGEGINTYASLEQKKQKN